MLSFNLSCYALYDRDNIHMVACVVSVLNIIYSIANFRSAESILGLLALNFNIRVNLLIIKFEGDNIII